MLTRRKKTAAPRARLTRLALLGLLSMLIDTSAGSSLQGEGARQESKQPISHGHQIVVLLDVNPDQRNVLPLEKKLAEDVAAKLAEPGNVFSVITFGAQHPTLLVSRVQADEAIAALQQVGLGQPSRDHLSMQLYDALDLALDQFTDDSRPKSLLVITEGNDQTHRKTFKHIVSEALQLPVTCNVAMVAEHPFYGSKSIQKYGFYLRKLAGKTGGLYGEVGSSQKRASGFIGHLSDRMHSE